MLYLLKGSRVQEYHQQNVAIVGAAESDRFEITYTSRWIASGLEVSQGDGCVILFADSPYEYFVPVRYGVIESVDLDEKRMNLLVKVKSLVREGGIERVNSLFAKFDRDDPDRPGQKFIFEAPNPGLETPRSPSEFDGAWREIVDALRSNGHFEKTTFSRLVGLRDDRGLPVESYQPIQLGRVITAELELRTPSDRTDPVSVYVEPEPPGAVELDDIGSVAPNGTVHLQLRPRQTGSIRAVLRSLPDPSRSSRTEIVLSVIAPERAASITPIEDPVTGAASRKPVPAAAPDLTGLVRLLRREADLELDRRIEVCELLLREVSPYDVAVLSELAKALYAVGRFDDCVRSLRSIASRRPDEETLLLRAALRAGAELDFDEILTRIDLSKESDFADLLKALESADRASVERVSVLLATSVLGDERLVNLAKRVVPLVNSLVSALEIVDLVAHVDPDSAVELVVTKWPASRCPERALLMLLDWGVGGNRLTPYFEVAMSRAADRQQWDQIGSLLDRVRTTLSGSARSAVHRTAGQLLLESGVEAHEERGFDLLVGVINDEISSGSFDVAVELCRPLLGHSLVSGDEMRTMVAEDLLRMALNEVITGDEYRRWDEYRTIGRVDHLRPRLRGRNIHFVGGHELDWHLDLARQLELATSRWHETEKSKGAHTEWVDGLVADRDLVIIISDSIGHDTRDPVKDKCDSRRIPRLHARSSRSDVLTALERFVAGQDA